MKTLVAYYSLSGTTRPVAAALAQKLNADLEEILCARYHPRFFSYIKAGYDSWADRLPVIQPTKYPPSLYDLVVIGGPMWAWRAATPVRTYLRKEAGRFANVAFFLTLGGAPAEKAFSEMEVLAGRVPIATLVVRQADVTNEEFGPAVSSFASALQMMKAA